MHTTELGTEPSDPANLAKVDALTVAEACGPRNPAFVQLLGLCPLLAVSGTTANALGLALATLLVLIGSNVMISLIRGVLPAAARLPAQMLVIAGFTTCAMLLMQAYAFDVYLRIALFVQIIVTNCIILARAEQVASRTSVSVAARDGLATGLGFALALISLGMVREVLGQGTLFAGMEQLLGESARSWVIDLGGHGLLLVGLPPGAFLTAALLIALANWIFRGNRLP